MTFTQATDQRLGLGARFVVPAISKGQAILSILNANNGNREP